MSENRRCLKGLVDVTLQGFATRPRFRSPSLDDICATFRKMRKMSFEQKRKMMHDILMGRELSGAKQGPIGHQGPAAAASSSAAGLRSSTTAGDDVVELGGLEFLGDAFLADVAPSTTLKLSPMDPADVKKMEVDAVAQAWKEAEEMRKGAISKQAEVVKEAEVALKEQKEKQQEVLKRRDATKPEKKTEEKKVKEREMKAARARRTLTTLEETSFFRGGGNFSHLQSESTFTDGDVVVDSKKGLLVFKGTCSETVRLLD